MSRFINRLMLGFVGLFLVVSAAAWAYQLVWINPAARCEALGHWWDAADRVCATPVYIPALTHRPIRPRA